VKRYHGCVIQVNDICPIGQNVTGFGAGKDRERGYSAAFTVNRDAGAYRIDGDSPSLCAKRRQIAGPICGDYE
jgi:hypothetical protein